MKTWTQIKREKHKMSRWTHWNYRLFNNKDGHFVIVECYYDEHDKPRSHTESIRPYGETLDELKQDFEWMSKAFDKPVLTDSDFLEENNGTNLYDS